MTPQDFIARWGHPETFVAYDADVVRSLTIPEDAKDFLIYPGLPRLEAMFIVLDNRLPMLQEAYGLMFERDGIYFAHECQHMRVLGAFVQDIGEECEHIASFALLDDRQNGTIVTLGYDTAGNLYPLFCNTTIQQYVEYCLILKEFREWILLHKERSRDQEYEAFVLRVESRGRIIAERLREIDPKVSEVVDLSWAKMNASDPSEYEICHWTLTLKALEDGWLSSYC